MPIAEAPGLPRSAARRRSVLEAVASLTEQTVFSAVSHRTAQAMLRPGRHLATAGALLTLVPPAVVLLAPLMLLAMPILFPLGLTLLAISAVQAALVGSLKQTEGEASPSEHAAASRVGSGTVAQLGAITASRGEALVEQLAARLRADATQLATGVRNEVEVQLSALQSELHEWVRSNPNLRPYSEGHIGWLTQPQKRAGLHPQLEATARFRQLFTMLPSRPSALSAGAVGMLPLPDDLAPLATTALERWQSLTFLIVPGLLTKWYPMYMASLRSDFDRLGLRYALSTVDSDQSVLTNAERLRTEILRLAAEATDAAAQAASVTGVRAPPAYGAARPAPPSAPSCLVLLCHSKGGVDAAAALSLHPELHGHVRALVTMQSPHSGSAIAHDLAGTDVQQRVAVAAIERLLRGSRDAVGDLTYEARREFYANAPPFPAGAVPTVCLASSDKREAGGSLLQPTINYTALRYGEWSDGCVCQADAKLPGCLHINLEDLDHFGPAWRSFPATDTYDPTRLWLVCASIAMCEGEAQVAHEAAAVRARVARERAEAAEAHRRGVLATLGVSGQRPRAGSMAPSSDLASDGEDE